MWCISCEKVILLYSSSCSNVCIGTRGVFAANGSADVPRRSIAHAVRVSTPKKISITSVRVAVVGSVIRYHSAGEIVSDSGPASPRSNAHDEDMVYCPDCSIMRKISTRDGAGDRDVR